MRTRFTPEGAAALLALQVIAWGEVLVCDRYTGGRYVSPLGPASWEVFDRDGTPEALPNAGAVALRLVELEGAAGVVRAVRKLQGEESRKIDEDARRAGVAAWTEGLLALQPQCVSFEEATRRLLGLGWYPLALQPQSIELLHRSPSGRERCKITLDDAREGAKGEWWHLILWVPEGYQGMASPRRHFDERGRVQHWRVYRTYRGPGPIREALRHLAEMIADNTQPAVEEVAPLSGALAALLGGAP